MVDGVVYEMTDEEIEEINSFIAEHEADEVANGYKIKRENEYPSIADQLDDLYHNGFDGWKNTIQSIKNKYSKP